VPGIVRIVIEDVQERDVFLNSGGTCLSVIEQAKELDVTAIAAGHLSIRGIRGLGTDV